MSKPATGRECDKGFVGLDSMISDVSSETARVESARAGTHPSPEQGLSGSTRGEGGPSHPIATTASGAERGFSRKWAVGGAAVIGLLWLLNNPASRQESTQHASQRPAAAAAPSGVQRSGAEASRASGYSASAVARGGEGAFEQKPPAGSGVVLSVPQIRYCLSEKIRVESMEHHLNRYSEVAVRGYNAAVDDYNSRCGNFRYRKGALEAAGRDIEPNRASLEVEGRRRAIIKN